VELFIVRFNFQVFTNTVKKYWKIVKSVACRGKGELISATMKGTGEKWEPRAGNQHGRTANHLHNHVKEQTYTVFLQQQSTPNPPYPTFDV
jgi:predicted AAA+ superfamily ATPase